ncbi:uncharacterized protein LOC125381583 [Haliotis rufescens]|uniref:uncharacterized protein LOC125381583 n=1 Tax=Haliotis rufescens TaxID=6454 RepID=UPI00201F884C|nr:uncharacterized protein LOC125381583 [Haliotis rufescens]
MAGLRKVEYLTSRRGSEQLILDGYIYNRNRERQTCTHWRCVVKTCNGKCTTVGDFLCNQSEHNHPPEDETRVNFVSNLRKRAREETTQMQALYEEQVTQVDEANMPAMPSFQSVKSALYRRYIPALPRSRSAVDIEDKWSETTDGRPFLLFSDGDDDKILAFSTAEQIQALHEADTLYMDGTFTACPGLWDQVYIIHARVCPITFPLVFALLPDRQATTYGRLFRQLKTEVQERLNRPLSPSTLASSGINKL